VAGDARVPFVGLTGGIAAGKSEALRALERSGAATLSSDDVVRELLTTGEIRDALIERFGDEVAPDGEVDRSAVADVVFSDPEHREWLEGLLWPRVGQRIAEWREELEHADPRPRAAVVEVPLLFESGMDAGFDATIAVVADDELRACRAADRGHEAVDERTARQLGQEEKAQRATYAVHNSGSLEELESKLSAVLAKVST
jgi:dephospho-CoA kinase